MSAFNIENYREKIEAYVQAVNDAYDPQKEMVKETWRSKIHYCVGCNKPVAFEGHSGYAEYEPHPVDGSKYCYECAKKEGFINNEGEVYVE